MPTADDVTPSDILARIEDSPHAALLHDEAALERTLIELMASSGHPILAEMGRELQQGHISWQGIAGIPGYREVLAEGFATIQRIDLAEVAVGGSMPRPPRPRPRTSPRRRTTSRTNCSAVSTTNAGDHHTGLDGPPDRPVSSRHRRAARRHMPAREHLVPVRRDFRPTGLGGRATPPHHRRAGRTVRRRSPRGAAALRHGSRAAAAQRTEDRRNQDRPVVLRQRDDRLHRTGAGDPRSRPGALPAVRAGAVGDPSRRRPARCRMGVLRPRHSKRRSLEG